MQRLNKVAVTAVRLAVGLVMLLCVPRLTRAQAGCYSGSYTSVTPCTSTTVSPGSSGLHFTFTIFNSSASSVTYVTSCGRSGQVTSCSASSRTTVGANSSANVTVTYSVSSTTGTGDVWLNALDTVGGDDAQGDLTVTVGFANYLVVSTAFDSLMMQDYQNCPMGCFAAAYAISTPPYVSLGTPRSVILTYNGDRVAVRPFVYADVSIASGAPSTPTEYDLQLKDSTGALIQFTNHDTKLRFSVPGRGQYRLAGQFDATANAILAQTGVYSVTLIISGVYSDHTETQNFPLKILVVNERASYVARGWGIAGLERYYLQGDSSLIITNGVNTALYFKHAVGNNYSSPPGEYSTLVRSGTGTSTTYTRIFSDSVKVIFNHVGQETMTIGRLGDTVSFVYDATTWGGRLIRITDPIRTYNGGASKSYIQLAYGSYGLSSIKDPDANGNPGLGRATTLSVAADSTLSSFTDPDGIGVTFGYDGSRRLTSITDRRGSVEKLGYDTLSWKVIRDTMPQIAVDAGGGSTTNQYPIGSYSPWQTVSVPSSSTVSTLFTPVQTSSVVASVSDPGGHTSSFEVDPRGDIQQWTDPLNRATIAYRGGQCVSCLDSVQYSTGAKDRYTYAGSPALLTGVQLSGASKINVHYGAFAQVDSIWGANRPSQRFFIGAGGRVDSTRIASADSFKTRYSYDSRNRLTRSVDPRSDTVRYHYDGVFGNLDSTIAPGQRASVVRYDRFGRDSASKENNQPWRLVIYDSLNKPTLIYDGVNSNPTRFNYDGQYLIRVQDPKNQVYRYNVNALGWVTQEFDPADTLNRYLSSRYNVDGLVTSITNRRNQRVDITYDGLHRMLTRSSLAGADSAGYDDTNRRTTTWNGIERDSSFFATNGTIDSAVTRFTGLSRRYRWYYHRDSLFRIDSIAITDTSGGLAFHTRTFGYNSSTGTLDGIGVGATVQMLHNPDMLQVWTALPQGLQWYDTVTTTHELYKRNFTNSVANTAFFQGAGYDSLARIAQTLRYNGSPTSVLNNQFSYDSLGRISATATQTLSGLCPVINPATGYQCSASSSGDNYHYDEVGNMTSGTWAGNSFTGLYAPGNRDTMFRSISHTFDLDGNTLTNGSVHYFWNPIGLLDSVVAGTTRIQYEYNSEGQLVRKRRNGVAISLFLWDGAQLFAELDSTGTHRTGGEYAYYPNGQPFAFITGDALINPIKYYVTDVVGNTAGLINETLGPVADQYAYDTWGKTSIITNPDSTNRLTWKSMAWEGDSTRLYYANNRWYDPAQGRFMTEDPLGLATGLNMYSFAGNDPINRSDATGLHDDCYWYKWSHEGGLVDLSDWVCGMGGDDGATGAVAGDPSGVQSNTGPKQADNKGDCGNGKTQQECDRLLTQAIDRIRNNGDPGCIDIAGRLTGGNTTTHLTGPDTPRWFHNHSRDTTVLTADGPRRLFGHFNGDLNQPRIDLWPIAYQSVTQLAITLAHEYVHMIDPYSTASSTDNKNGPAERVGRYCAKKGTRKWPPLRN